MITAALVALNALLRLHTAWFLAEVLLMPDDPRFAGKAIPIRNLVIVGGMSLVFPVAHLLFKRWRRYPWALDDVYLSVFWLDMAGNSFDLYDSYYYFDLIPHAHGSGAMAVTLERAFGLSPWRAFLATNALHGLLELQENLTDVFFGTHNVRDRWDTFRDLAAGLIGIAAYPLVARWIFGPAITSGGRRDGPPRS